MRGHGHASQPTLLQARWSSTLSMDRAMSFTFLLANSGASLAALPSSVVHTGVKSRGWEKRMHQLQGDVRVSGGHAARGRDTLLWGRGERVCVSGDCSWRCWGVHEGLGRNQDQLDA